MSLLSRSLCAVTLPLAFALGANLAQAHSSQPDSAPDSHAHHQHAAIEQQAFGQAGDPAKVTRTIAVVMDDAMRFTPDTLRIRQGETVRFLVTNKGNLLHEMVLGTLPELKAHGEMMRQHPDMAHDAPYMAHVAPGETQEIIWHFTQAGAFHFACLLPGHFEAGMAGTIKVLKG